MRAEMLMAKMAARGLNITGAGVGGRVELSWTDVAGAMGGLDRVSTELMRAVYLGDRRGDEVVLTELRAFVLASATQNKIKISSAAVHGLAMLALYEVVNPSRCLPCGGTGETNFTNVARLCDKCQGSGYGSRVSREQAVIAGIPRTTFDRNYSWLAGRTYLECSIWLNNAVGYLQRRMSEAA